MRQVTKTLINRWAIVHKPSFGVETGIPALGEDDTEPVIAKYSQELLRALSGEPHFPQGPVRVTAMSEPKEEQKSAKTPEPLADPSG